MMLGGLLFPELVLPDEIRDGLRELVFAGSYNNCLVDEVVGFSPVLPYYPFLVVKDND